MSVVIVVGVQWGDEGKGKVVDYLTEDADLVVRFQGGNNAGHTLVVDGQRTALQTIPSGILRKSTRCLLASGVVLDLDALTSEIKRLEEIGVKVTPNRLGIASNVQLIMPYHKAIDVAREAKRGGDKIGTTGKGIGPAYEDSVSRQGIRLCDLFEREHLLPLIRRNVEHKNSYLKSVLNVPDQFCAEDIHRDLLAMADVLEPYAANVSREVDAAAREGRFVVFEGAQGCLLDINHGTYPFVTSSNTVAAYACVSAGIGPRLVDEVVGICKAYCTRVGSGPFPTEDVGADGQRLREVGREYGTVTGRARRCGWFDATAVRRAVRLNGIDSLFITKLDVLSGFESVKLGLSYRVGGRTLDELPASYHDQERLEVDYEVLPGWTEDLSSVRSFDELPSTAKDFLKRVSEISQCVIRGFSVGPDRVQTISLSR